MKRQLSVVLAVAFVLAAGSAARADLVGYWPLDGDATATVGTDGVLVNGPTATTDRNGAAGGGLAFDGSSSQYVSVAGGGGLNNISTATVSMWVQWNGMQDDGFRSRHGAVLGRQKNSTFSDNILCLYSTSNPDSSNINWETRLDSGMGSGVAPGDGTWRHVAVTVSPGGGEVLYVDGVQEATRGAVGGFRNDAAIPLTIGAWIGDGGSYSTSRIDDVAIWNEVLSATDIADLADQTATPLNVGVGGVPADLIAGVTIEDFSSELSTGFNRLAIHTVDGSGLSGGQHGNIPNDTMWETHGTYRQPNDPLPGPYITFDLEGNYDLDRFHVWNYNEVDAGLSTVGVNALEISVASSEGGSFTSLGNFTFAKADGSTTYAGETIDLSAYTAADNARLVRFDIVSSHGGGNSLVGLSEVQFFGDAPRGGVIPEPITMLAVGLGIAGLGRYVRRRKTQA